MSGQAARTDALDREERTDCLFIANGVKAPLLVIAEGTAGRGTDVFSEQAAQSGT